MGQSIQAYLHGLPPEQKRTAGALIALIRQAAPQASAAVKWGQIAFEQNGPVCFIRAAPSRLVFGFWRGAELDGAKGRLVPDEKAMAHVDLAAEADVNKTLFQRWVKDAVRLNRFRPLAP